MADWSRDACETPVPMLVDQIGYFIYKNQWVFLSLEDMVIYQKSYGIFENIEISWRTSN